MAEPRLAISELVTNAVVHGGGVVGVRAEASSSRLRVEVVDRSPGGPHRAASEPASPGGRGLMIVEAVVDRWGVEAVPDGPARKVVWFEIDR